MKTKIALLLLGILTIAALGIAYNERSRSSYIREDVMRLHRELKKAETKFEAVRIEAAKLRFILDNERKKMGALTADSEKLQK